MSIVDSNPEPSLDRFSVVLFVGLPLAVAVPNVVRLFLRLSVWQPEFGGLWVSVPSLVVGLAAVAVDWGSDVGRAEVSRAVVFGVLAQLVAVWTLDVVTPGDAPLLPFGLFDVLDLASGVLVALVASYAAERYLPAATSEVEDSTPDL